MSRFSALYVVWFARFRTREFSAIVIAAASLAALICDWCQVSADKRAVVIGLFTASIAITFILNPKYAEWVIEAKPTLEQVQQMQQIVRGTGKIPGSGSFPIMAGDEDDREDPLDESRDKDLAADPLRPISTSTPSAK